MCIYLRSDIQYKQIDVTLAPEADSLFIEITLNNKHPSKNIIVGAIYRLHEHTINNFNTKWDAVIKSLNTTKNDIYLLGDFNIDLLLANKKWAIGPFF